MEKVVDYSDLSQNKKPKEVLNFSENQTLITQRLFISSHMQSNLVLQKEIKINRSTFKIHKIFKKLNKDDLKKYYSENLKIYIKLLESKTFISL